MDKITIRKEIGIKDRFDVVVAGGGVAGCAAAVSAAREGKRTLLIEKSITLGGLATSGLVNWFVPSDDGRGTKVTRGIYDEMFSLAVTQGYDSVPDEWKECDRPGPGAKTRFVSAFSANIFTLRLTKWLRDEGVAVLFDTLVTDAVMKDGCCEAIVVENKSGTECYSGKVFIDSTGDADLLFRAGVPTVQGRNYHTFYGTLSDLESCRAAAEQGDIRLMYKRHVFGGGSDLYGNGHPGGMPFWLGTSGEDVSRYVTENHVELLGKLSGERRTRDVSELPHMVQLRTTRRIDGDYTLTENDVFRHFPDSVSAMGDFDRPGPLYEIPYRVMVKSGFRNLIAAGRTTSGSGYGWDLLRVIPPAVATGQAARIAAAISVDDGVPVTGIDVSELQRALVSRGAVIHFDKPPDGPDDE